jgi:uncharacterized protein YbcV (DUF1398 family)
VLNLLDYCEVILKKVIPTALRRSQTGQKTFSEYVP